MEIIFALTLSKKAEDYDLSIFEGIWNSNWLLEILIVLHCFQVSLSTAKRPYEILFQSPVFDDVMHYQVFDW